MRLRMRRSSLGLLDTNALRATLEGVVRMIARRRGRQFIRRRGPACRRGDVTRGVRGSHAIASGMAGSGDMAFQAGVATAVELIVAHPVAMETGSPVAYMRIQEWFIVLGYGKIRGVQGSQVIRDMDIGRKHGVLCSKVI